MRGRTVDLARAAAAALVPERPGSADARHDKTVLDALQRIGVPVEPAKRAQRSGAPEESIGVSQGLVRERTGDGPEEHDAREVVVGQRGMADVGADEELRRG